MDGILSVQKFPLLLVLFLLLNSFALVAPAPSLPPASSSFSSSFSSRSSSPLQGGRGGRGRERERERKKWDCLVGYLSLRGKNFSQFGLFFQTGSEMSVS